MIGATSLLTETLSWLSSSAQLISGAVNVTEKIAQFLSPTETDFTSEELELLFVIQSYLLGILNPLKLCVVWKSNKSSCVTPVVDRVELILRDVMGFVHPLLLGQRPIAAAKYVASQRPSSSILRLSDSPLYSDSQHPIDSRRCLFSGDKQVRLSLAEKLKQCCDRLSIALSLLNTALTTIQMIDDRISIKHSSLTSNSKTFCLATLLSAHQQALELDKCTGDLTLLRGLLALNLDFFSKPLNMSSRITLEKRVKGTSKVRISCPSKSQPAEELFESTPMEEELQQTNLGWHILRCPFEMRLKRVPSGKQANNLTLTLQASSGFKSSTIQPCCSSIRALVRESEGASNQERRQSAGFVLLNALIHGRAWMITLDHAQSMRAIDSLIENFESTIFDQQEAEPSVENPLQCGCATYLQSGDWDTIESNEENEAGLNTFEHVDIDDGKSAADLSSSDTLVLPQVSLQTGGVGHSLESNSALNKASCLMCDSNQFFIVDKGQSEDMLALIVRDDPPASHNEHTVSRTRWNVSRVLEFVYLSRLLSLNGMREGVLSSESHETLLELFS